MAKIEFSENLKKRYGRKLYGRIQKGCNLIIRRHLGGDYLYALQNPFRGTASEAQAQMRRNFGAASLEARRQLRNKRLHNSWLKIFCCQTRYKRLDCFVIAVLMGKINIETKKPATQSAWHTVCNILQRQPEAAANGKNLPKWQTRLPIPYYIISEKH